MKLKKIFYTLLDISGVLLGIYLFVLGWLLASAKHVSSLVGWITLVIGVGAFLIHLGHYFNLGYIRWLFGADYFLRDKEKDE